MVLPASGPISMSQINTEFGLSSTLPDSSFTEASLGSGSYPPLNPGSLSGSDATPPHAFSEFYGYNHTTIFVSLESWACNYGVDVEITGSSYGAPRIRIKVTEFLSSTSQSLQPAYQCFATGSGGMFSASISLENVDTDEVNIVALLYSGSSCDYYANAQDSVTGEICTA